MASTPFGITDVRVKGFRTARDVAFSPGPLCALVGEADAGKSNLLAAIRAVLDPAAGSVVGSDMAEGGDGHISIRVTLADGGGGSLEQTRGGDAVLEQDGAPRLVFLPAEARSRAVLTATSGRGKALG